MPNLIAHTQHKVIYQTLLSWAEVLATLLLFRSGCPCHLLFRSASLAAAASAAAAAALRGGTAAFLKSKHAHMQSKRAAAYTHRKPEGFPLPPPLAAWAGRLNSHWRRARSKTSRSLRSDATVTQKPGSPAWTSAQNHTHLRTIPFRLRAFPGICMIAFVRLW